MNIAPGQKQFLKSSWVWEKSGQDASLPLAMNQKAVGPAEESCLQSMIEKP
jgi:hypothetical protein